MRVILCGAFTATLLTACSETTTTPLPSPPENVAVSLVDRATVSVTWSARPSSENVVSYGVYRDGRKIGTSTTTSFLDTSPPELKSHAYAVASQSADGTVSELSASGSVFTPDATPPRVLSTTPVRGEINIIPKPTVRAVFSEPLAVSSVDNNALIVKLASTGALIPGATIYLPATNAIQWQPSSDIPSGQRVLVSVGPNVQDTAGNKAKESFGFDFTIREGVPPTIVGYFPDEGATISVYQRPAITFSEPMQQPCCFGFEEVDGTDFVLAGGLLDATQRIVTINPVTRFKPGATYHLIARAPLMDVVGNLFAGTVSLTFAYANDFTLSTVVSTSPADGATGVVTGDLKLTVTLDHPLVTPYGYNASWELRTKSGELQPPGSFIYAPYTSTLTYTAPNLQPNTSYVVTLRQTYAPAGVVIAENSYSWGFTTGN